MKNCYNCGKEISEQRYHKYKHLCEDCYRLKVHRKTMRGYLIGFSGTIFVLFGLLSFYLGRIILSLGSSFMRDVAIILGFLFLGLGICAIFLSTISCYKLETIK